MAHGTFLEEEIKSGKEILYLLSYFCRMTDKVPAPMVFRGRHNRITRTQMSITVSLIEEKPLDAFAIGLRGFWGGYKPLFVE